LRLPKVRLNVKELLKIPTGSVAGNKAIQAVLTDRAYRYCRGLRRYWPM
jgi:hypothetical protein